ncbi:MAG: hypothetical protein HWN66_12285 [Candidatus Helarchaeota archaeon]|nr:hypothetical protein [Candidatus Helarchaeota archaeon]
MPYTYGDLPETRTKRYYPLGKHLMRVHSKMGFDYLHRMQDSSNAMQYPVLKERLTETIATTRAVLEGKLRGEKIITYMIFPPVSSQRGDLTQGSMKLLYGDSVDLTFIVMDDNQDGEISFILNGHEEDGIPVDWWLVGRDDELLERRHLKLGYKLKELPSKVKNLTECGRLAINILRDVRNERTPHWSTSAYHICMTWGSGGSNQLLMRSSWEGFASLWDGVNAKRIYGLPDYWFCYIPWPAMVNTLFLMQREQWTMRICGLTTGHKLYLQGHENIVTDWMLEKFPEIYNEVLKEHIEKNGVPTPVQTLECQLPNLRDKSVYEREDFAWYYPHPENFIKLDDLGIDFKTFIKGIFLDVTHETTEKVTGSHIISYGMGRNTKFA